MRKLSGDFPTLFGDYVEACACRPFRRGVHDCLTFVNGAVKVMFGEGFADDVIAHGYDETTRSLIRASGGFHSLPAFLDSRLLRISTEAIPRASVIAISQPRVPYYTLGIAFGDYAFVVDHVGTTAVGIEVASLAWSAHPL